MIKSCACLTDLPDQRKTVSSVPPVLVLYTYTYVLFLYYIHVLFLYIFKHLA